MFFSSFSISITSLGEEKANLSAFRTFMSYLVLFRSCFFFSPFSIAITTLGEERANLNAFRTFVRFALVWFFVCFLFLLVSGKGCGLRLWHSLDFSLTFFNKLQRTANILLTNEKQRNQGCVATTLESVSPNFFASPKRLLQTRLM